MNEDKQWSEVEINYLLDKTKKLKNDSLPPELLEELSKSLSKSPEQIIRFLNESAEKRDEREAQASKSFLAKALSPRPGVAIMQEGLSDYSKPKATKFDPMKREGVQRIFDKKREK